jgi:hypothetical protein
VARHDTLLGNPPAVHPREPPETTGYSQSAAALKDISRMHWGGTLLEQGSRRNRKFAGDCAEPVEDESSLWKALGKDSQNLAADLRGSTQIKTPEKKARPKPCPSNQRSSAESAAKEHGGCPIPDSALFAEFRACPELVEGVGKFLTAPTAS